MSSLFIPAKIRVGFQNREGTYTGKLAYVIYYDAKGKLRKEKSWQQWRDDEIEPEEFENKPQDGFHLNKDIQRYNWSHFGSNRSYIRIYDSRGIEFEITPENLIGLLTETTCSKRGLDGEFVYAWCGKELVLLPCSSEEYGAALKNTERQGKTISARDLKPGCSYTTKKGEEVIYMGRFPWFTWDQYNSKSRISQKKHIFACRPKPCRWGTQPKKDEYNFLPKGDASFLAELNSEEAVQNYPKLVDDFNGDIHSSEIKGWKTRPFKPSALTLKLCINGGYSNLKRNTFMEMVGDQLTFWKLGVIHKAYPNKEEEVRGYRLTKEGTLDITKLTYQNHNHYYDSRGDNHGPVMSEQQVLARLAEFVEVDALLASGKKLHIEGIGTVAQN